jgi:hypothetical protein
MGFAHALPFPYRRAEAPYSPGTRIGSITNGSITVIPNAGDSGKFPNAARISG